MMTRLRTTFVSAALLALAACAPDLREDFPFDGALALGGHLSHRDEGAGVTFSVVDATHKEAWVYVDLDAADEVDALTSNEWDLGFQRFKIISNGGVSGPGTVEVANLGEVAFESVERAPESGFTVDAADGDDSNSDVDSAFLVGDEWYAYDLVKHRVEPRKSVYVVHTPKAYFKLQLMGYYDSAGSAAKISFRWAPVPAP